MSDDFTGLHLKTEYRTSIALTSKDFYTPILQIATKYDRAVFFHRLPLFILQMVCCLL